MQEAIISLLFSAHQEQDRQHPDNIFIGGTDQDIEGTWTWLDNKPWEYDNFQGDEPNGGDKENCIEIVSYPEGYNTAGWWNDIDCSSPSGMKSRAYVCAYDNGNECFVTFESM